LLLKHLEKIKGEFSSGVVVTNPAKSPRRRRAESDQKKKRKRRLGFLVP